MTAIGPRAFLNCSSLKSITIPESVMAIGDSAFEGCSSLESISELVMVEEVPLKGAVLWETWKKLFTESSSETLRVIESDVGVDQWLAVKEKKAKLLL